MKEELERIYVIFCFSEAGLEVGYDQLFPRISDVELPTPRAALKHMLQEKITNGLLHEIHDMVRAPGAEPLPDDRKVVVYIPWPGSSGGGFQQGVPLQIKPIQEPKEIKKQTKKSPINILLCTRKCSLCLLSLFPRVVFNQHNYAFRINAARALRAPASLPWAGHAPQ